MPTSARQLPRAAQSADRCGRRAACPHAAGTGCIDRQSCVSRTRIRTRDARPYGVCVGRGCIRRGGAARAADSRPYRPAPQSSRRGGYQPPAGTGCIDRQSRVSRTLLRTRDARPYGVRWARVHPTRRCSSGGYKIRPYGPASGALVGAGFMPARDQVPFAGHTVDVDPERADVGIGRYEERFLHVQGGG